MFEEFSRKNVTFSRMTEEGADFEKTIRPNALVNKDFVYLVQHSGAAFSFAAFRGWRVPVNVRIITYLL
jgi:hypothetical protein